MPMMIDWFEYWYFEHFFLLCIFPFLIIIFTCFVFYLPLIIEKSVSFVFLYLTSLELFDFRVVGRVVLGNKNICYFFYSK